MGLEGIIKFVASESSEATNRSWIISAMITQIQISMEYLIAINGLGILYNVSLEEQH